MGVWIETSFPQPERQVLTVTPYVGVWIETQVPLYQAQHLLSHPTWVCGLKP